ncbi:hypothetical protein [Anianabacter salinae]|uniref:hypothetical protein n=1 Tax=Anianabacter salinae TaxID=2851023 RepID=UPI00225DD251|nr:hypothetical protein [Anianabacter salinae]MBV0912963.1 hypothetical protein [Anianabacter salinae]
MFRRPILAACAAMLPASAIAQDRPGLLDLITPDRIIRTIMQSGIMTLRTQMDVKYGDMSVDFAAGRLVLTDVQVWPLPDWDDGGDCLVEIDRLTIRTAALDEVDRLRIKVQTAGASMPPACLPEEAREGFGMLGLERLVLPRLALDIDYDIPSSAADMVLYATVQDVASAELSVNTTYVWADARDNPDEPAPVVFLDRATLSVENLGGWETLKGLLPPPLSDPGSAPLMIEGMLGGMMIDSNGAAGDLSEAQATFLASVKEAWPAFLSNPERLVLETSIDGDTYIDFEALEASPLAAFDTLRPVLGVAPAAHADVLPTALLTAALNEADMSPEDRRRAGLALVTGTGAPRDIGLGVALLAPLAEDGDGEAALVAAEGLATRDPQAAYRLALIAGAAEQAGATALLDRLEREIGLAAALDLQAEAGGLDQPTAEDLGLSYVVRDRAAQQFSGNGATRNYAGALMWATIGAAAGDAEAASILSEIDARMAWEDGKARTAWDAAEAAASRAATEAWLNADMPARLGSR